MPEITLVKTAKGVWRGISVEDEEQHRKFKRWRARRGAGEFFTLNYDYERNPQHHRKFMSLVTYIAENSDVYNNKQKALAAVKLAAGHCDYVPNPKTGELTAVPKSINFKEMKQAAFDEFYENAIKGTIEHILPYMNKVNLQLALETVAAY